MERYERAQGAERCENSAELTGVMERRAAFSHSAHGMDFFTFDLNVPRASGAVDILRVIAPLTLSPETLPEGARLHVAGPMRNFRSYELERGRLCVGVLARLLETAADPAARTNRAAASGTLLRAPVLRRTPLGREICDMQLGCPRGGGRREVLPVIAWGATARQCAHLSPGDALFVEGRLQSRVYRKQLDSGAVELTAYELSAARAIPLGARAEAMLCKDGE